MSQKHKVFLSFHHQDDYYRQKFEQYFSNYLDIFVNKSVKDGDIDPIIVNNLNGNFLMNLIQYLLIVLFKMEILIQIIKLMLFVERFVKTIFLTPQ